MSLVVNHNLMAANTARNLNTHYGRLATSAQRLSSGLRINGAADAAGLAIRELMRADVAALHQGVRNANDAISMIQVTDGALAVIDEKLIRMKELAEQAATGTYDSTQRLMIDSEFQAMASEIQRFATATDFNGIKLIDGKEMDEVKFGEKTVKTIDNIQSSSNSYIANYTNIRVIDPTQSYMSSGIIDETKSIHVEGTQTIEYTLIENEVYKKITNNLRIEESSIKTMEYIGAFGHGLAGLNPSDIWIENEITNKNFFDLYNASTYIYPVHNNIIDSKYVLEDTKSLNNLVTNGLSWAILTKPHRYSLSYDIDGDGNTDFISHIFINQAIDPDTVKSQLFLGSMGRGSITSGPITTVTNNNETLYEKINPDELNKKVKIHFGPMNDSAEDYYDIEKRDCTLKGLGIEDLSIETQDKAQNALVEIDKAIVKKDQARAYYGAMQNRLENTVSNLTIQAENLQVSESRISDIDVATEMTNFVRNQILTQSAVAMLGQANSLPQMAMQLIGG